MKLKIIIACCLSTVILWSAGVSAAIHPDSKIRTDLQKIFQTTPQVGGFPFQEEMEEAAIKYNMPLPYVLAVARGESFFDPKAISSKGAIGIMQVMPATAADYGVSEVELYDPVTNIDVGVKLLADLYTKLNDPYLTLAAYYCGCGGLNVSESTVRKDCDEYVRYIYSHLQKVLASDERDGTPVVTVDSPKETIKHFILTSFDNFLDAENFIKFINAKLPNKQFDLFRSEVVLTDHFRYQYQIMAEYRQEKDKSASCRSVSDVTGFLFCE